MMSAEPRCAESAVAEMFNSVWSQTPPHLSVSHSVALGLQLLIIFVIAYSLLGASEGWKEKEGIDM